ncbi:MAG: hypothetical protein JWO69_369 [Thermoleophilia bacterium]|jgi:hypothetical protein|nr:hypothetical protein [Thermoleophilia bacterium]
MRVPNDIQRIARSWAGDTVFEAAGRRSERAKFGAVRPVTAGGLQQVRRGTLDAVIDGAAVLGGAWRQTPLAVVDLGRGYWLVSQTHRDGRRFTPSDSRPGLWNFQFGSPSRMAAVVDHTVFGANVMTIGRYSQRAR